ncbi:hypothetical protein KCV87_10745 [Actinosynnema pretiosum subsp. pretiosum]|uniref:Lipoprotein n=2 Tax=Actinosynnema TaxID=40566 RepID=C6WE87_ACTMD|nr:hypothetical protein [Actinosynnema mirum]ACU35830.1 hypothetical protein Amir_1882 [Actinosynnema mirum DSM 43827]AXX29254.1 hypothetical protein APASM_1889 [Actinosynnema pretiosum subsp. pretiosum]QUF06485.1 hypothetical protein KCV87_10745 [Actinosynnema pretiosum subsp. pretiosum]
MKSFRSSLFAAVGAAAVLLSACGSETSGTALPAADATASSTAEESAPTSSSAAKSSAAKPTAADAPVASGDVAAPGSEFEVGQRAVVNFKYGTSKTGVIAITVDSIEAGDPADLAKYGDKAAGITPFYIRATVENVGGTDLAYSSLRLRGIKADGKTSSVIITGETDNCQTVNAGKDFTTAGAKFQTCVLQAGNAAEKITGAKYDAAEEYTKSPVVWKG